MRAMPIGRWIMVTGMLGAGLLGCRELGLVQGTPRERYEDILERAGLAATALGQQWHAAAREALAEPVGVELPFRETGYFRAESPRAAGFEFTAERGQRVTVQLAAESSDPVRIFLELFSAVEQDRAPERLVSADSGETGLDVEIETSGRYLVRVQPELLRAARYTLVIRSGPTLAFPVDGVENSAIRSRFGADRDGGRRRHEGIDIFAPRGTPVLAGARGRVVNVGDNRLGGLVVWLRDEERNQSLYYAHLDRQVAREGMLVERGDTLGLVGNTGNARTTPPHLHFGIYRRGEGAIDPLPFVWRPPSGPPSITVDTARLGEWIRVAATRAVVRQGRGRSDTLPRSTVMRVLAAAGDDYRVELPDRRVGYVPGRLVQAAAGAAGSPPAGPVLLLERPAEGATPVGRLEPGSAVEVRGSFNGYDLVEMTGGGSGWLRR